MSVIHPGRPAYSTDFCRRLITVTGEKEGREQVAPCGSPLTVVADGAGVIESVCGAGHRYVTCTCQQPDCSGWKAISVGGIYPWGHPVTGWTSRRSRVMGDHQDRKIWSGQALT
jgi:hypothetical protein